MRRVDPKYAIRQIYITIGFLLIVLCYIARLFYLQLLSEEYKQKADGNAFYEKILYPSRGMMYDAKGRLIVFNKSTAIVTVVTREMKDFDTLALAKILNIDKAYISDRLAEIKDRKRNKAYSPYVPQPFINQISEREAALLREKLYRFPGFKIENRSVRAYTSEAASLILGTTGEVNREDLKNDTYYRPGDYSGRTGLELSYERELRGVKGVEILLRDSKGRIQGRYKNGELDQPLESGKNLHLGLDIDLQAYGEKLMKGKRGAIVMIEPKTGLVRCMVSAPSFSPRLLLGRKRGEYYNILAADPQKPLLNRAIMGAYPPGSTFKVAQGAIFLAEKAITPNTLYSCHGGYPLLGGHPACHAHPSPISLVPAIATSCNSFFCWGLRAMIENKQKYGSIQKAFDVWKDYMVRLGFGYALGIDLPGEKRGYIPNSKVYDKIFSSRWKSSSIISIAIGQGEILATPLQIANLACIVANRGYFYKPHLVEKIDGGVLDSLYIKKQDTGISAEIFNYLVEGMSGAVTGGTCRRANIPDLDVCGKTGTAENPHGKSHSIFMSFAPKNDPKIALCVFVENAGYGASFAVPIGRLMLEKYLHPTQELSALAQELEVQMLNAVQIPIHPDYYEREEVQTNP